MFYDDDEAVINKYPASEAEPRLRIYNTQFINWLCKLQQQA